jgi:hypothetical protein
MSSTRTKAAIAIACAALISTALVPAFARSGTQPPPPETQTQAPPPETMPAGTERQSKPEYGKDTPKQLRLRDNAAMGRRCRSGADNEAEAVEDCTAQLNCPAGTAVKCTYRPNNQDWICSCK